MIKWIKKRWKGRTCRRAGEALRFCLAIYLMLQLVYTPFHLYLEPHSDFEDSASSGASVLVTAVVGDDGHDGDSDHERHSAAHHDLKALRTQRAPVAEMGMITVVECLTPETDCPHAQVFEFSGLSPPELPRGWQFLFRAALPVRAPSIVS